MVELAPPTQHAARGDAPSTQLAHAMAKLDDPAALDKHMATKSSSPASLSKADVELYAKVAAAARVCERGAVVHIASLPEWRQIGLAGPAAGGAAAAAAARPRRRRRRRRQARRRAEAAKPAKSGGVGVGGGAADASAVEDALRAALTADGKIADTLAFAAAKGLAHEGHRRVQVARGARLDRDEGPLAQ